MKTLHISRIPPADVEAWVGMEVFNCGHMWRLLSWDYYTGNVMLERTVKDDLFPVYETKECHARHAGLLWKENGEWIIDHVKKRNSDYERY